MCCVNPQMGERIRNITRFYFDFHWKQEGIIGCVINDPLAVAYFIDRTLCSGMEACTRIATEGLCIGQSVVDRFDFWKGHKNSYILTRTSPLFILCRCFFVQSSWCTRQNKPAHAGTDHERRRIMRKFSNQ